MKKEDRYKLIKDVGAKMLHDEGKRYHKKVRPTKNPYNRQKNKRLTIEEDDD